jgi:transcriptional regulator of heat shock response
MLNLEQGGFLAQPHTSAGRMPTVKAYRYFVGHLLKGKESRLPEKDQRAIDKTIDHAPKNTHAMSSVLAKTMANLTEDVVISGIRDTDEFYRRGFANIFEWPEFEEAENIFGSGSIFDQFENYFGELFQQSPDQDVVMYIGRENLMVGEPGRNAANETVIITKYPLPRGYEGISAVIGPMRMAYDHNMAMLRYVAKRMNELE